MRPFKAMPEHFDAVRRIVTETIEAVYPRYYPRGAVDFFMSYHNDAAIRTDIDAGRVWLFEADGEIVGTGTVKENEIGRLFVPLQYQGRGYGRLIMDFFEDIIFTSYDEIKLDASFAAQAMYRARGYTEVSFNKELTANGDYLCWCEMRLKRPGKYPRVNAFEVR